MIKTKRNAGSINKTYFAVSSIRAHFKALCVIGREGLRKPAKLVPDMSRCFKSGSELISASRQLSGSLYMTGFSFDRAKSSALKVPLTLTQHYNKIIVT